MYLRIHNRIHQGKPQAYCNLCDKHFVQSYNYKLHVKKHHMSELEKLQDDPRLKEEQLNWLKGLCRISYFQNDCIISGSFLPLKNVTMNNNIWDGQFYTFRTTHRKPNNINCDMFYGKKINKPRSLIPGIGIAHWAKLTPQAEASWSMRPFWGFLVWSSLFS